MKLYDCIVRFVIIRKLGKSAEDRNKLLKVVQQCAQMEYKSNLLQLTKLYA
jgi:hypothetical protein